MDIWRTNWPNPTAFGFVDYMAQGSGQTPIINKMSQKTSYAQILKSSSIMGGAAGVNLILGMVRTKFAAILIGTTGFGLLASFTAIQGIISTLFGLGIDSSAVREVALAVGKDDKQAIGRAVLTLRRLCWFTGLTGMLAMVFLSSVISQLTFGSDQYIPDIAALGVVVLLGNLSGGRLAVIQGMRRIGDMARANILGAAFATVVSVFLYSWLGQRGIVPALVCNAVIQLGLTWWFARRVYVLKVEMSWRETFVEAGGMVRLGQVFMLSALMGGSVSYITVALITQNIDLYAVGIYSAAFSMSGMFVNFVLSAMGADYYPRLMSVAHDKSNLNQLVNEQTEIGLLLAVPGLLATMALAPWIISLFYTSEFLPAVGLLQWFVLGCLGRVISWPLSFVMMALGKGRWFLFTESTFNLLHVLLIAVGLLLFGIEGVAIGFFVMYLGYVLAVYFVGRHLTGFRWSVACKRIAHMAFPLIGLTFVVSRALPLWAGSIIGVSLTILVSMYSLRELEQRIGAEHRIFYIASKIPGLRALCKLK